MNSRIEGTEHLPRRAGRSRRRGACLLLLLVGLVGFLPTVAQATPTFKIRIVDLSSPLARTGETYMIRTDVVTTCSPVMQGGFGACETIDVTITWWTDPASVKVGQGYVLMLGGPMQFQIPASDINLPTLHYRIVAKQVWNRREGMECLVPQASCPKEQTAATQIHGSTQVVT